MASESAPSDTPTQSAFFRALESSRYERQRKIGVYEESAGRSLIVFWGPITAKAITPFADAINDVHCDFPLDLMLTSYGGNGEAALRLATMCHAEREDFRVIVPDTAASAATLLALAAESILMSSTSALGPIDPQIGLPTRKQYIPAKNIVSIVEDIVEPKVKENPQLLDLYTSFLGEIDAVIYQTALSAIERTEEVVPEILELRKNPLSSKEVKTLVKSLQNQSMHSATIGHTKAEALGLPVEYVESQSEQWDQLWRLHTDYVAMPGPSLRDNIIEGRRVSFILKESPQHGGRPGRV